MMRLAARVALFASLIACVHSSSASRPLPMPSSFPATSTEEALRQTFRLSAVHDVKHPDYPDGLKALVTAPDEDGAYALAFYRKNGQSFEIVGASMEVLGCALPTVRIDPGTHLPALRAPMQSTDDAELFFIQGGTLHSGVEHPESWTVIKRPRPQAQDQVSPHPDR